MTSLSPKMACNRSLPRLWSARHDGVANWVRRLGRPTRAVRCAGHWVCAFGLLVASSLSFADDGIGLNQVRFVVAESSAAENPTADSPAAPKSANKPSVLVPRAGDGKLKPVAEPTPGEPEKLPSPAADKPSSGAAGAAERVPYQIVPICQLKADMSQPAAPQRADFHPDMKNYAADAFAERQVIDARGIIGWQPLSYTPLGPAATVCHHPAYFAQPPLERYGQSHRLPSVWSGAQFYGTVMVLPAMWMIRRPWNHVCRDPMSDPAGFDATVEFFRPPVVLLEGPDDPAVETP